MSKEPGIRTRLAWLVAVSLLIGFVGLSWASATTWSVSGRYVTVNDDNFTVHGVGYSPVPIGASRSDDGANRGDVFTAEFNFIYERDLPLLRAAGVNSIRLYLVNPWKYPSAAQLSWTSDAALDHTDFLDQCWNDGQNPVFVWLSYNMDDSFHVATSSSSGAPDGRPTWRLPNGDTAYLDPSWDEADAIHREYSRNAYVSLASLYGEHSAVAGIVVSNEQNNELIRPSRQFWEWFDETASLVKEAAPTKLTTMALVDDDMLSIQYAESFGVPNIDVWGINSYRGTVSTGFDTLFSDFAASSNKPLLVSEYGTPASTRDTYGNLIMLSNNSQAQADYLEVHYNDLVTNRDITSGGFVFAWTDGWWKYINPAAHDASPDPNPAFPGGWDDEEYFGINSIAMSSPSANPAAYLTRGADVLSPRAAIETITTLYSQHVTIPPQFPASSITLVPNATDVPISPSNAPQNPPYGLEPVVSTPVVPSMPPSSPASSHPASAPSSSPSSAPTSSTPYGPTSTSTVPTTSGSPSRGGARHSLLLALFLIVVSSIFDFFML